MTTLKTLNTLALTAMLTAGVIASALHRERPPPRCRHRLRTTGS